MSDFDPRPRNEVKKVYLPSSPGAERKRARVTLTELKKGLKAKSKDRKAARAAGLIS